MRRHKNISHSTPEKPNMNTRERKGRNESTKKRAHEITGLNDRSLVNKTFLERSEILGISYSVGWRHFASRRVT